MRRKGLNPHQKAVYRVGERRAGSEQITELLELAKSADAEERCHAAENLCPCHVRKRIETVWEALFVLLEDPDVRVRRAAWHTLEDGGRPDDPALDAIMERVDKGETDPFVRRMLAQVDGPRREKERITQDALVRYRPEKGKCDFCAKENVPVTQDSSVDIPDGAFTRAARVCADCAAG